MNGVSNSLKEETVPADSSAPSVVDGNGAPKGLSATEHFVWAHSLHHSAELQDTCIPSELKDAVFYEFGASSHDIDAFRYSVVRSCIEDAEQLQGARSRLLNTVASRIRPVVSRLHVPFVEKLCSDMG